MHLRLPRDQRRAQLIDVATERFGERGFHPTSMDDIAITAGITKPVLYQHFISKEELYIAVIEKIGASIEERIEAVAELEGGPEKLLRDGIDMFFTLMKDQPSILHLFFGSEWVSERVSLETSRVVNRMAEAVGHVVLSRHTISEREARTVGHAVVAAIQAAGRLEREDAAIDREETISTLVTILARGLSDFSPLPR